MYLCIFHEAFKRHWGVLSRSMVTAAVSFVRLVPIQVLAVLMSLALHCDAWHLTLVRAVGIDHLGTCDVGDHHLVDVGALLWVAAHDEPRLIVDIEALKDTTAG